MPTLNWIGKEAVVNHHRQVPFHLLKDVPDLSCGEPGDGNLIVQGDNLVALKALLPYYAGQVKCIYIDPPYNTGNENWVYNDNVNSPVIREWLGKVVGKEGETLDRHDRWLCMMYPRLALLRQFLRQDGVIFVSIDDNEIHDLRYVMDDLFGGQNFIACIEWQKMYTVKNSAKYLSEMHDHLLFYAKRKDNFSRNLRPRDEETDEDYDNPDDDERGPWISNALQSRNFYSKGTYAIKCPGGRVIEGPSAGTYWRLSEIKFWKLDADRRVWWGKDNNGIPRIKKFLSETKSGVVPTTWWPYKFAGSNSTAKTQLRDILQGKEVFITPKPIELIQRILEIASGPDSLVLDSFAGSGTTGHAVLDLNKQDGGNRSFILVEMEQNICRDITAERVRRVVGGYKNAKGEKVEGLGRYPINVRFPREVREEAGLGLASLFSAGFCEHFYDQAGAIRDMIQSHLLQVLALMLMPMLVPQLSSALAQLDSAPLGGSGFPAVSARSAVLRPASWRPAVARLRGCRLPAASARFRRSSRDLAGEPRRMPQPQLALALVWVAARLMRPVPAQAVAPVAR